MGKAYTQVSNDARKELIRMIYEEGMSIVKAAEATGIYYPTAKAINKVYKREQRVQKRSFRYRTKKEDEATGVIRNKIPIEKLLCKEFEGRDRSRITCGVRLLVKKQFVQSAQKQKSASIAQLLHVTSPSLSNNYYNNIEGGQQSEQAPQAVKESSDHSDYGDSKVDSKSTESKSNESSKIYIEQEIQSPNELSSSVSSTLQIQKHEAPRDHALNSNRNSAQNQLFNQDSQLPLYQQLSNNNQTNNGSNQHLMMQYLMQQNSLNQCQIGIFPASNQNYLSFLSGGFHAPQFLNCQQPPIFQNANNFATKLQPSNPLGLQTDAMAINQPPAFNPFRMMIQNNQF